MGKAAFGPKYTDGSPIVLQEFDVSGTALYSAARACHEFLLDTTTPIDKVDYERIRDKYLRPLSRFLQAMPDDDDLDYLTPLGEYSSTLRNYSATFEQNSSSDHPLRHLFMCVRAKVKLARFLKNYRNEIEDGLGFSDYEIGGLSGTNVMYARCRIGRDTPIGTKVREGYARWGDELDTLEWLASQPSFYPGPLSSQWLDKACGNVTDRHDAGAIMGMYCWINRMTTESLSDLSGLSVQSIRSWTRGDLSEGPDYAKKLALAAGLEPNGYTALVNRVLSPSVTA